jgi:amino-acid N-acetyltransferase
MIFSFASSGDEVEIKDLLSECGLPRQDISALHLKHFLILKDEMRIIGVVGLEVFDHLALLRSLAVRAQDRNRGWASQLITRAEEYARSLGVQALYLLTLTAADFFARRGYERFARDRAPAHLQETEEFHNLCPASAVCMVKDLNKRT